MSKNISYTTQAICSSHNLTKDIILEMVSWGIANPAGRKWDKWVFSQTDYERIGRATQFNRELEINISGAALVLQLLEELDKIRKRQCH